VLVYEVMQAGATEDVYLRLGWRLGDERGPWLREHVPELVAASTVYIILEVVLAKRPTRETGAGT
jgi:hypothetical protein